MGALLQLRQKPILQSYDDTGHAADSVGAFPGKGAVGGPPGYDDVDASAPLFPDGDPVQRLLADDHTVGPETGSGDDVQGTGATRFLIGDFGDDKLPTERYAAASECNGAHDLGRHARLVVTSAAAVNAAVVDLGAKWRVRPGAFVADR